MKPARRLRWCGMYDGCDVGYQQKRWAAKTYRAMRGAQLGAYEWLAWLGLGLCLSELDARMAARG